MVIPFKYGIINLSRQQHTGRNEMNELQSIEFSYSSILKKFTVRTKGIELKGVGINQIHSEKNTGFYNVYSLTRRAFEKVSSQYKMSTY